MRLRLRVVGVLATTATVLLAPLGSAAHASHLTQARATPAVFVQTNDPAGNSIAAFHRSVNGTLTFLASYPTGGKGGRTAGSSSDPLASQGSLAYDAAAGLLLATNAGSNTVSVFGVQGDHLDLRQVVPSGGPFPVSIAIRGSLVYVLDAGRAGYVSGYRLANGQLTTIPGSTRTLGLSNADPPYFLSSPAQVGLTPTGTQLLVTTKNHGTVDVFSINPAGRPSGEPVEDAVSGVPFAFVFDPSGQLALVNAASSSLGTYTVNPDGTLTPAGTPVSDGQIAACWVAPARGSYYLANTGSGTISQYRVGSGGGVTLVSPNAASGISGPTDLTSASGGRFLYNLGGTSSSVGAYLIHSDGTLSQIQSQPVPGGANQEGIVATRS